MTRREQLRRRIYRYGGDTPSPWRGAIAEKLWRLLGGGA